MSAVPMLRALLLISLFASCATLNTAIDRYEFDVAAAILAIIIVIVMLAEYSSGYLRKWAQ